MEINLYTLTAAVKYIDSCITAQSLGKLDSYINDAANFYSSTYTGYCVLCKALKAYYDI